ncbi:MAG TPA: hypothetical protein PKM63_06345 [Panacibacter sp.]|nr:hypothetical protein [Panacibacter sp.]HNP43887.1 hypothetical protein [Panacibacter sp.]
MNPALWILPVTTALVMWLSIKVSIRFLFRPASPVKFAGIRIQGIFPQYQSVIARQVTEAVINEIANSHDIKQFITGPRVLEKIMPSIEIHLDDFLNRKLKEALPVISLFVGEKVIAQLKALFIQELQVLFPSVMSQLFDGLQQNRELADTLYVKLCAVNTEKFEEAFYGSFKKALVKAECGFAVVGFLTGLLQLLIILYLN